MNSLELEDITFLGGSSRPQPRETEEKENQQSNLQNYENESQEELTELTSKSSENNLNLSNTTTPPPNNILNDSIEIANPEIIRDNNVDNDSLNKRFCWVCFANDEDDEFAHWVRPCKCRGTTKWVHQACLLRWIDEKTKLNTTTKVSCPQCQTEYILQYPKQGILVVIMDSVDALISRISPFVAAGIVVGSIYWTAVTYGAVTVMQVAGHKEGLSVMEQADPLVLLVGLPTIPVMLIVSKMIRWEETVLRFIRKHSWRIPLLKHILPSRNQPSLMDRVSADLPALNDPVSATRILCGALLLPTVASLLGKVLFENVRSNFKRALLGGAAFITIKGILRIYHKQQQYVRQAKRKITDYNIKDSITTDQMNSNNRTTSTPLSPQNENLQQQNQPSPNNNIGEVIL